MLQSPNGTETGSLTWYCCVGYSAPGPADLSSQVNVFPTGIENSSSIFPRSPESVKLPTLFSSVS